MGRYDNFKYFNGTDWVQPSQVQVKGNSFIDLGTNTSSNTANFKVMSSNGFINVAKNKQVTYGDKYVNSIVSNDSAEFKVRASKTDLFVIEFTIKVSSSYSSESVQLFKAYNSYLNIGMAVQDGVYYVYPYKDTLVTLSALGTFTYDEWVTIKVTVQGNTVGTTGMRAIYNMTINGETISGTVNMSSGIGNITTGMNQNRIVEIGSSSALIKGGIYVQSYNTTGVTFDISDISTVGQTINYTYSDTVSFTSPNAVQQKTYEEWV